MMKIKNILKNWKVIILLLVLLLMPSFALALTLNVDFPPIPTPGGSLDLNDINIDDIAISDIIILIYSGAIWIGGIVAFVSLVYVGFLYIFSGNAPGNRSKAKGMLTNIAWGLGILLLSWITLNLINPDFINLQDSSLLAIEKRDTNFTIGDVRNRLNFACLQKCEAFCDAEFPPEETKDCKAACELTATRRGWPLECENFGTYSCAWLDNACIETNNGCANERAPLVSCRGLNEEEFCNSFVNVDCSGEAILPPTILTTYTCVWDQFTNPNSPKCVPTQTCDASLGLTEGTTCDGLNFGECSEAYNNAPYSCISSIGGDQRPGCTGECVASCGASVPCIDNCYNGYNPPLPAECPTLACPINISTRRTASYCTRRKAKFHNGTDILAAIGTKIHAVENGTIKTTSFGWSAAGCRLWVVDTPSKNKYFYGHLGNASIGRGSNFACQVNGAYNVKAGDKVTAGQVIAFSGNTYRSTYNTSPHLHLTVTQAGGPEECPKGTGTYPEPTISPIPILKEAGCAWLKN